MIKYYYHLPTKFRRANTFNFPTEIEAYLRTVFEIQKNRYNILAISIVS